MIIEESSPGRCLLARLDHGAEIISQITDIARERKIRAAAISAIGALSRADLGFYDQAGRVYLVRAVEEPVEIASCAGNISLLDGQPFVHAHAVLADSSGVTFAGHLVRGSIFAAELFLQELPQQDLHRTPDSQTGLKLWNGEQNSGEKR
ncbi:MAG: DNA-binding protein [Methanothrix sp.]|nr:DNA-binding protein [Methanothrix sp.]